MMTTPRPSDSGTNGPPQPEPILHVAVPAVVGGLERVVQGLATGQRDRGLDVHVAAVVDSEKHPFLGPLLEGKVPLHTLLVKSGGLLRERAFIAELLDRIKPRVVHTHGYRPDLLDAPLARKRGLATVTTEHGSSKMGGKSAIYEWVQSKRRKDFAAVVAVSAPIAHRLVTEEGVAPERVHLIPNAWASRVEFLSRDEARRQLGLPSDGVVIGWVGRMIRAKGPDIMAKAARYVDPDACLVFIGDGPLQAVVKEELARNGALPRTKLLGHMDNAAPFFPAMDVLALTSRTEGTPIVLLEAMAAGVPIVATQVGGVVDMVSEKEAVLVLAEDPSILGHSLSRAAKSADSMKELACRARERLDRQFSKQVWLDRHEEAYRSAIEVLH